MGNGYLWQNPGREPFGNALLPFGGPFGRRLNFFSGIIGKRPFLTKSWPGAFWKQLSAIWRPLFRSSNWKAWYWPCSVASRIRTASLVIALLFFLTHMQSIAAVHVASNRGMHILFAAISIKYSSDSGPHNRLQHLPEPRRHVGVRTAPAPVAAITITMITMMTRTNNQTTIAAREKPGQDTPISRSWKTRNISQWVATKKWRQTMRAA